jgi:hypothetical protein
MPLAISGNQPVISHEWAGIVDHLPPFYMANLTKLFSRTISSIPNCVTDPCPELPLMAEPREARMLDAILYNRINLYNTFFESEYCKEIFDPIPVSVVKFFADHLFLHRLPELERNQEFLRLRIDDKRDKILYLAAEWDHNGALEPGWVSKLLTTLAIEFDLKYKVIRTFDEICEEVREAVKTGKIASVIIEGHGEPDEIALSVSNNSVETIDATEDFAQCFSGLDNDGQIILLSCLTGAPKDGDPFNNIADKIATGANRVALAPVCSITPDGAKIISIQPLALSHPVPNAADACPYPIDKTIENVFRIFKPRDPASCPAVNESALHPKEKEAMRIIQKTLADRSLVTHAGFQTQDYFRLCKANPNEKLLFLVAENDPKGALHPQHMSEVLCTLAETMDLKYKVVKSLDDICDETQQAPDLSAVVIAANDGLSHLLLNDIMKGESQSAQKDRWTRCFAPLKPSGRIFLVGYSSAKKGESNLFPEIAQRIAHLAKRTVIAPMTAPWPIEPNRIMIQSVNPLMFFHPTGGYSILDNHKYNAFGFSRPNYIQCSSIDKNKLLEQELKIMQPYSGAENYNNEMENGVNLMQLCADDPKDKFLYLDANDIWHSTPPKQLLGRLSKTFDVDYKVVSFFNDFCTAIKSASSFGKLAHVLIAAPQTSRSSLYAGYEPWNRDILNPSDSIAAFNRGLRPDGWIISEKRPYEAGGEKIGLLRAIMMDVTGFFMNDPSTMFDPLEPVPETQYPDAASVKKVTLTPDNKDLPECFKGLAKDGKVIVLDEGGDPKINGHSQHRYNEKLGQILADNIQRNVIVAEVKSDFRNGIEIPFVATPKLPTNDRGVSFKEFTPKKKKTKEKPV